MNSWEVPTAKIGAGAVIVHDGKVLLVQINYGERAGRWILPGGKVENEENLEQAVIREVFEETGLQVEIEHMLFVRQRVVDGKPTDFYFVFRVHLKNTDVIQIKWPTEEVREVRFWSIEAALESPDVPPTTKLAIQKASKVQNQPFPEFPKTDFIYNI